MPIGPEHTPNQPPVTPPVEAGARPPMDASARIKAMLAESPLPVSRAAVSPAMAAHLSRLSASQAAHLVASPAQRPNQAPAPAAVPKTGPEGTTNGINIKIVNGEKDRPKEVTQRFSRTQEALAFLLVTGAVASGGIYYVRKNGLPWQHDQASATVGAPVKPGVIAAANLSTKPSKPASKASPTAVPKSCPPSGSALPAFQPQAIENAPLVSGTINDLEIPIEENYVRPGDPKKQVFKLDQSFSYRADGAFSIKATALVGTDPSQNALRYDTAASASSGNSVVDFSAAKMTTILDLSHVTLQLMGPKHTSTTPTTMGMELAQTFNKDFTPALTVTPAAAANIYTTVLNQKSALSKAAAAAIVNAIQKSQTATLANLYETGITRIVRQQQLSQCIPASNFGDTSRTFDFSHIPNMAGQYPAPAADPAYSLLLAKAVMNPGKAASGATPATPATITLKAAGEQ